MTTAKQSAFRFLNYKLESLHLQLHNIEHDKGAHYSYKLDFTASHKHLDVSSAAPAQDITAETTRTLITLDLKIAWQQTAPFDLELRILGEFAHDGQMDAQTYQNYVEIHAPAVLLAHARPIINSLMREAQQPFLLPLFNISEAIRGERKARDHATPEAQAPQPSPTDQQSGE